MLSNIGIGEHIHEWITKQCDITGQRRVYADQLIHPMSREHTLQHYGPSTILHRASFTNEVHG